MNIVAHQVYEGSYPPNLFIGGVSATINTASALATKLGISVSNIKNFRISGSNIQSHITADYILNSIYGFSADTTITYFKDKKHAIQFNGGFTNCTNLEVLELDGLINILFGGSEKISYTKIISLYFPKLTSFGGNNSIRYNSLLASFDAPELTSITGNQNLMSNSNLAYINIPKVNTQIGSNATNDNTFNPVKIGCVINANIALQTSNSGAVDADLQYAITSRSAVVNWVT